MIESAEVPAETSSRILKVELNLQELNKKLNGDNLRSRYEGAVPMAIKQRVRLITSALWSTTEAPTNTFKKAYDVAADKFGAVLASLKNIDRDIKSIESILNKYDAPYTPGRFPEWNKN